LNPELWTCSNRVDKKSKIGEVFLGAGHLPPAAKGEPLMSEVISKLSKNSRETIFLSLSEFKGRRLVDIRVHVPGEQEDEWVPTRKGVSLAVSLYPAFKQALAELEEALVSQGLLDREDLEAVE
jgi:hypothetical protein